MKKIRIIALALSVMMLLAACGGGTTASTAPSTAPAPSAEPAAVKDTFNVAGYTEPPTLDPHIANFVPSFMLDQLIFDKLFVADINNEIHPQLAETWEWIDDTTLRVKIREGVMFTNGTPLTADDVVYSIQRACVSAGSKATFSEFDGPNTAKVDEYTVDIKTKTPYPNAITVLTHGRGSIVCQEAIEEMGEDAYGRAPVGSGEMIITDWTAGDSMTFVRNDEYWGDKPAYKTLYFRIITEGSSRAIELETGAIDFAFNIDATDLARLQTNPDVTCVVASGATMNQFVITTANFDLLDDVRVRKAMHMALDMNAIVATAYRGIAEVADSLMPKGTYGYTPVGPEPYDPEGAKALLVEAGFDTNQVITLNIVANDSTQKAVAEMACNMWKDIGLNVQITQIDRATMTTNNGQGLNLMCMTTNTTSSGNPETTFLQWEKASAGYTSNTALVEKISAAKRITDEAERTQAYKELQQECWDEHIVIPVSVSSNVYCYRSNVKGLENHPSNMPELSKVYFE